MQIEPAYLVKPVVLTCKRKYPPMISSAAETAFFGVLLCSLTQRTHLWRELQKQEPKPQYGARDTYCRGCAELFYQQTKQLEKVLSAVD